MKPIVLDDLTRFRYLSGLETLNDKLLFVDTLADMDNNDYTQRLHLLNPATKEDKVLTEGKRTPFFVVDGKVLVRANKETEFVETSFNWLNEDGTQTEAFTLPLGVNSVRSLKDYYLVEATITVDCPDYFCASTEEKKAFHEACKKDEDYIILNEYPFFFNGAGFINGNRNNLFLVDKKTLEVKRIASHTMDVESIEVAGDTVYFMGNDYADFKDIWSSIYSYDVKTGEFKTVYFNDKDVYLRRILMVNGELYALGCKETCIGGQSFWKIVDGKAELAYKSELMFGSSVGSDARYGHMKQSAAKDGKFYYVTTIDSRSDVLVYDGKTLEEVTNFEGSVDGITFVNGELYGVCMVGQKLQEVFKLDGLEALTALNVEVMEDRYVAKPERFTCFNVDEIVGWALKPMNFDPNKKYPCILDIHGGPKTAYGEVYYHEMQLWASMGYFVVYCNPHCSDGRGDEFSNYIKHYGATDYDDIMAFCDKALELYPQIDPERFGVTGGSYGGYMTNFIIGHTDRFKCAASQRSIANRVSDYFCSDYSYDVTHENGVPMDNDFIEMSWKRSPLKYWENVKTPTLFIQSTNDYRCPFDEAIQMFTALKFRGVEARLCGFKGENHELSRGGKPLHRIKRLAEITNWMEQHLN